MMEKTLHLHEKEDKKDSDVGNVSSTVFFWLSGRVIPINLRISAETNDFPSKIEWDLTNGPLLLDTQV